MTDQRTDEAFQRASHRQINRVGVVGRMSQDERRQFVVDFIAGRVFTSAQITEGTGIASVFMPLALFPVFKDWEEDDLKKIGVIWEHLSNAGPLGINGLPMFFSMRMMHRDDWDRCLQAIQRELDHQRELEV